MNAKLDSPVAVFVPTSRNAPQVFTSDVEAARPTKHMVDLDKRVDRDKLTRWMAAYEAEAEAARQVGPLPDGGGQTTSGVDNSTILRQATLR